MCNKLRDVLCNLMSCWHFASALRPARTSRADVYLRSKITANLQSPDRLTGNQPACNQTFRLYEALWYEMMTSTRRDWGAVDLLYGSVTVAKHWAQQAQAVPHSQQASQPNIFPHLSFKQPLPFTAPYLHNVHGTWLLLGWKCHVLGSARTGDSTAWKTRSRCIDFTEIGTAAPQRTASTSTTTHRISNTSATWTTHFYNDRG